MAADLKALEREQEALQARLDALEERRSEHEHDGPDPCPHCLQRDIEANRAKFPQNALSDVIERHLHRKLRDLELRSLNFADAVELTISSGVITPTQTFHLVDTEADAAMDNLAGMAGGAEGDVVYLNAAVSTRGVIIKNEDAEAPASERFFLPGLQDIVLEAGRLFMPFVYFSSRWRVLGYGLVNRLNATVAPGVTDDLDVGYSIGSLWIDVTADKAYVCLDNTDGAAVWTEITGGGGGANHNMLDGSVHPDSVADAVTRGSIIYGNATPKWDELVVGAAGAVLGSDGTDAAWTVPKRTINLLAQGGAPATTSGCDPAQIIEAATNDVDYWVLDFDASADEFAFWGPIAMPANYDGGVMTAIFYWTTAATGTTGVAWAIQLLSLDDNDAIDSAWGTAIVVADDAQGAAGEVLISAATADITPGGTASAPELLFVRVFRDVSDANDDMTEDARLLGVKLLYTVNAVSDA